MSKQRRTADDFIRDMKAKQQHSTPGDIERKTSEGKSELGAERHERRNPPRLIAHNETVERTTAREANVPTRTFNRHCTLVTSC